MKVVRRVARRTVSIFLINEVIHYKRSFSHNINYTLNHSLVSLPSKTKGLLTSESNFNTLIGSIEQSERKGADFEVMLQELTDWPHEGVPDKNGTREGEKELFNFRKNRRQTYNSFLKSLDIVEKRSSEQEQTASKWQTLLRKRLERIEDVWEGRK